MGVLVSGRQRVWALPLRLVGVALAVVGLVILIGETEQNHGSPNTLAIIGAAIIVVGSVIARIPWGRRPRICPSCGADNRKNSAFCHKYGKPLPPPPA